MKKNVYILSFILVIYFSYSQKSFSREGDQQNNNSPVTAESKSDLKKSMNLTEKEAVKFLFDYLYPGENYFLLTTTEYLVSPEADYTPKLTYVFTRPSDGNGMQRQITSYGLSKNKSHYIYNFYTSNFFVDENENRKLTHYTFYSNFAVNIENGEVVQQRTESGDTDWILNENFPW